jgi:hypothetical protein
MSDGKAGSNLWPESYLSTEPIIVLGLITGGRATAGKKGLKAGNRILNRVTSHDRSHAIYI